MQSRCFHALPLLAALVVAACGSDKLAPAVQSSGAAAHVSVTTSPAANVSVGASAGTFSVKVTDATGAGVSGVLVTFSATGALTAIPSSSTTDASGVASTQVSAGTIAGAGMVSALATGVTTPATATITVIPGSTTALSVTPKTIRFSAVGDTIRISAVIQDQYGNTASSAAAITYTSLDPSLVSVDAAGLARALRLNGSTQIVVTSNGKSDTVAVTVLAAGASACTGFAATTPMTVGEIRTLSTAQYQCISSGTSAGDFALVAFNSSTDQYGSLSVSVTGDGLAAPPLTALLTPTSALALKSSTGLATPVPVMDEQFHVDLLQRAQQELRGGLARLHAARQLTPSRSITGTGAATSAAVIPATAQVGDVITMNVSSSICTSPIYHALRVTAIGSKSIVLADTLNPAGGFSSADYGRIAANFDTLVYALDVGAFGAPSDVDGNGRVAILFTRSVNELVDANSGYYVGGFFNPRDLFPKKGATTADDCAGSNEGEMFYMLVPAPSPGINGVTHTTGFVDSLTTGVLAHEFQHLINAGRRMYVNTSATAFEDSWLNEGLSHIAEELLYYRESKFAPRQNLDDATIRVKNPAVYPFWKNDASSNFSRLLTYLRAPETNSPYAPDDQLATRGAAWAFLRYAADRVATTDGTIWQRFDNATTTGLATLQLVFGQDPIPLFHDFSVANYADDLGTTDPRYLHASWNFRNIFTTTFLNQPSYPLKTAPLTDKVKANVSVRGISAAYLRFSTAAGKEALLNLSSGGAAPISPLQFTIIRTR